MIFNSVISLQFLNIPCISVTNDVLKLLTLILINFLHDSNIFLIFVTDEVSKCDTSKLLSSLQLLNIYCISITFEVSKLLISKIKLFKFTHLSNILFIFITLVVLKLDTFNIVKDSQFLNIESIYKTSEVIKYSDNTK